MASHKYLAFLILIIAFCAAVPAAAQNFDTSGNSKLNGDFFVRQVVTTNLDTNTSAIGRAISIVGIMTFDGNGNYTFTGQKVDTSVGNSSAAYTTSGTYAVESNGMAQIQNPIDSTDTDYGAVAGVGPVSIVASATEGQYNDIFVAIEAGTGASNATLSGLYNVGFIDFLGANASQVRDGYYTLSSSGSGSLGTVSVSGAMANQGNNNVTQSYTGVTYAIAGVNGAGTLTFPTASTPLTSLVSGQKTFYVSADGTLLLGGDPNGFDIIFGMQSLSTSATNGVYTGTYYNAALENDASDVADGNNAIDSFYGSNLALGSQGAAISHLRLYFFGESAYDYTTDEGYNFGSQGSYNDGFYQYQLGVNGQVLLMVGYGSEYSLTVNLLAQSTQATSVFIDPLSIFNAASYAPITNSVAPGEFITIFGSGLASSTQSASSLPLPTTMGTTQVTVNGTAAPLDYVSPTQINFLIPTGTSVTAADFATFQVTNNGVKSNPVTVYLNLTAPGVFTLTNLDGTYPPGTGPAAVQHADYSLVTTENPAVAGETLILYVTGLGAVTPPVPDGAAAGSNPVSTVNEDIEIDLYDQNGVDSSATVVFAGLTPGLAGLYQINFVVPSGVASGPASLGISTNEAYTNEAFLFMQ